MNHTGHGHAKGAIAGTCPNDDQKLEHMHGTAPILLYADGRWPAGPDLIPDQDTVWIIVRGCNQDRLNAVEVKVVRAEREFKPQKVVAKGTRYPS